MRPHCPTRSQHDGCRISLMQLQMLISFLEYRKPGMPLYIEATIWPKEFAKENPECERKFDIYALSQVKKGELYWNPFYRAC